ncbi:MAG TPA: hypothetical protein EYH05_18765 [Anaerolineae bacterium]|nr:hypothetical protein [Anaerolineae bacterium]
MFNDPILDFIARPENLELALEVSDYVKEIKKKYHKLFWQQAYQELNERIKNNAYDSSWIVTPVSENKLFSTYTGCSIRTHASLNHSNHSWLRASLSQANKNSQFRLYYGFQWTEKAKEKISGLDIIRTMADELAKAGFKDDSWWLGWKWLSYHIYSKTFLVRMSQNPSLLVKEVIDPFWSEFEKRRVQIETVNQALSHPTDND